MGAEKAPDFTETLNCPRARRPRRPALWAQASLYRRLRAQYSHGPCTGRLSHPPTTLVHHDHGLTGPDTMSCIPSAICFRLATPRENTTTVLRWNRGASETNSVYCHLPHPRSTSGGCLDRLLFVLSAAEWTVAIYVIYQLPIAT